LRLLTNNIKILSHIHIEVNKETYKAYFQQRINEQFVGTEPKKSNPFVRLRNNKKDPYRIRTGFAAYVPTPEEQAEIDNNKAKTAPIQVNPRWLKA